MSEEPAEDGPGLPAPLSTWPKVYGAVLVHLGIWIAFFIWLTRTYG